MKSNAEYAGFARRALRAYRDRVADSDEFDLAELVAIHSELEDFIREAINRQLIRGMSWTRISEALGLAASTARGRWGSGTLPAGRVVYGLQDKDDRAIRYIGQSKNAAVRLAQHRASATTGNTRLANWISRIGAASLEMVVLQTCSTDDELNEAEAAWIARLTEQGLDLLNTQRVEPRTKRPAGPGRPKLSAAEKQQRAQQREAERRADTERLAERQRAQAARMDADSPYYEGWRQRLIPLAAELGTTEESIKTADHPTLWLFIQACWALPKRRQGDQPAA